MGMPLFVLGHFYRVKRRSGQACVVKKRETRFV